MSDYYKIYEDFSIIEEYRPQLAQFLKENELDDGMDYLVFDTHEDYVMHVLEATLDEIPPKLCEDIIECVDVDKLFERMLEDFDQKEWMYIEETDEICYLA